MLRNRIQNKLSRFKSQSHDRKMINRIMGAKGNVFGQNIAKRRPGRNPVEATQRMRNLRASSPLTGQMFKRIRRFR